ncbi:hypothetical protein NDU88_005164 [Pleurodeles waltl]|uniref:Uncharacterized protein n=1 Tax=Pleurodeles waltl TaxID=8319 RepID=A0AAV7QJY6_PLEWA|nr:hypothetical protein NDU88_005164 [Pleurodeles waltl]
MTFSPFGSLGHSTPGQPPPGVFITVCCVRWSRLRSRFDAGPPHLLSQCLRCVGPFPPTSLGLPVSFFSLLVLDRQGSIWAAVILSVSRGVARGRSPDRLGPGAPNSRHLVALSILPLHIELARVRARNSGFWGSEAEKR